MNKRLGSTPGVLLDWPPLPSRERAGVRVQRGPNSELLSKPWFVPRPTPIPRLLPEREREPKCCESIFNRGTACRS